MHYLDKKLYEKVKENAETKVETDQEEYFDFDTLIQYLIIFYVLIKLMQIVYSWKYPPGQVEDHEPEDFQVESHDEEILESIEENLAKNEDEDGRSSSDIKNESVEDRGRKKLVARRRLRSRSSSKSRSRLDNDLFASLFDHNNETESADENANTSFEESFEDMQANSDSETIADEQTEESEEKNEIEENVADNNSTVTTLIETFEAQQTDRDRKILRARRRSKRKNSKAKRSVRIN